jgi:hypothetical protein
MSYGSLNGIFESLLLIGVATGPVRVTPMREKLPACVHCNRGARTPVSCPHCWWQVCCSERCLTNHIKAAHPKQAAAMEAQKESAEIEKENRRRELRRLNKEMDRLEKEKAEAESGLRGECPNCKALLSIPRKYKGKKIPCPHCKAELHVPEAEVVSRPPEPAEPFWTVRRVAIGLTFWAVVLSCCCGVPGWIWHAQTPIREADRLYDEGRKAEAVARYQEMWERVGAPGSQLDRIGTRPQHPRGLRNAGRESSRREGQGAARGQTEVTVT